MSERRFVTIMVIPEGGENRRSWRVRQWILKAAAATLATLLVGIIFFFIFYSTVLSRALMTEQLHEENENLKKYRYKVQLLEHKLKEMERIISDVAELVGIDIQLPTLPDDSTLFAQIDRAAGASIKRPPDIDWSIPIGLPVVGFVSQDFDLSEGGKYHPGIDIACAEGTPVLATGSGLVTFAGYDSTYGHMVVIRHSDSVSTLYGHNDSLLVGIDQEVTVGSRIALTGNTGESSAPHLHYELRINDQPTNPLENPYD